MPGIYAVDMLCSTNMHTDTPYKIPKYEFQGSIADKRQTQLGVCMCL